MAGSGENLRKTIHVGAGFLALLLRVLTPAQAMAAAVAGIGFNALLLPRLTGRRLEREEDRRRGYAAGILLYPVTVLLLLLLFPRRPAIVAAAWGVLAFGDGAGSIVGRAAGLRPLPWNRGKTVGGSLGFLLFGTLGSAFLYLFVQAGGAAEPLPAATVFAFCAIATAVAAMIEAYPTGIDDNLTVPLAAAAVLFCLHFIEPGGFGFDSPPFLVAAAAGGSVNLALAFLFRHRGWVNRSGAAAGFAIGTAFWAFGGWRSYLLLLLFFLLGNGATRIGFRRKDRLGIAQEGGGARSARHAVANTGVAVFLITLAALSAAAGTWFRLGAVAALATAAFDTVSSEIGQLFRRGTVLITTLRPVPPGTDGAVSPAGTAAGAAAAAIVAAAAWSLSLLDRPAAIPVVLAAAFAGATAESFLGATWERRHRLDNEAVNFLNTLIGSLAGIGIGMWLL